MQKRGPAEGGLPSLLFRTPWRKNSPLFLSTELQPSNEHKRNKKTIVRDFPGAPVTKTLGSQ